MWWAVGPHQVAEEWRPGMACVRLGLTTARHIVRGCLRANSVVTCRAVTAKSVLRSCCVVVVNPSAGREGTSIIEGTLKLSIKRNYRIIVHSPRVTFSQAVASSDVG